MLQNFKNHIDKNLPFLKGSKLLIAISGGIDSVVLTHLLHQLNFDIKLAHCNFQLRGEESDIDELFIKNLGTELNIPVFTIQFETAKYSKEKKLSTQLAARELRYNWFHQLIEQHKFEYVLTAHHADDNLETFLINLSRGTGLDGLTGIPEINKNIIRPLLSFSQKEIEIYAGENSIKWREDKSNQETKYLRNKIRHQITPLLKEINPQFINTFNKTLKHLKQSQQIIDAETKRVATKITVIENDVLKINLKKLAQLPNPNAYLYQVLKTYRFTEWNDVYNLVFAQSGKKILTKFYTLLKDRDFLLLLPTNNETLSNVGEFIIKKNNHKTTTPIKLLFEKVQETSTINNNTIYVDEKLLNYPLRLRHWNQDDIFFPKGMTGRKKVSKYFKDEKISIVNKHKIWLLCTNKNEIIWIVGKRQDRRFLPNDKTTGLMKISI